MSSNTLSYQKRCFISVRYIKQTEFCFLFLFSCPRYYYYYWLYHSGTLYFGRLCLRRSVRRRGMLCRRGLLCRRGMLCMRQWDDAKSTRNDNNKHTCNRARGSHSLTTAVRSCQPRRSADRLPSECIASAGTISSSLYAQCQRTPITNSASTWSRAATTISWSRTSTTILCRRTSAILLH